MNVKREKFLTEAMGECWHEEPKGSLCCPKCFKDNFNASFENMRTHDFSTWGGFGKLWEWAQKQEWWDWFYTHWLYRELGFKSQVDPQQREITQAYLKLINPNRFADVVYEFLKAR